MFDNWFSIVRRPRLRSKVLLTCNGRLSNYSILSLMSQKYRTVFSLIVLIILLEAIYHTFTVEIKKYEIQYETQSETKFDYSFEFLPDDFWKIVSCVLVVHPAVSSNASTKSFIRFDRNVSSNWPICDQRLEKNLPVNTLIYRVNISRTITSYDEIENKSGLHLQMGGHWSPSHCQSEQRVALIVCYRNREQHLQLFLNNIHPFLQWQLLDYTIIVVNQHGQEQFNRGALFNIGYLEAMKLYPFTCLIFHDVDLLPEDRRNLYRCHSRPRHMSVSVDKFDYKLLYPTLFGGVTAFEVEDFVRSNGYPNIYWGWGNEDDDMYLRVTRKLNKTIIRYPLEVARYQMIRSHGHTSAGLNPHRHTLLHSKYNFNLDGLNTIRYKLHQITFHRSFTLINVTLFQESFDQIYLRLNISQTNRKKN